MDSPTNQPTDTLPTKLTCPIIHLVISKPYDTIKALVKWISENCEKYLVGQHSPEEYGNNRIHCHIMIVNCKVTTEALRKQIKKDPEAVRGSYAIMTQQQKSREEYNEAFLGIYILKGSETTCKETNYCEATIEEWIQKWVNNDPQEDKPKDKTIWDILLTVYKEGKKVTQLDNNGALVAEIEPSHCNWILMTQKLNENKIRTSRNELERAWVTLLRMGGGDNQRTLYTSIMENVFRLK